MREQGWDAGPKGWDGRSKERTAHKRPRWLHRARELRFAQLSVCLRHSDPRLYRLLDELFEPRYAEQF